MTALADLHAAVRSAASAVADGAEGAAPDKASLERPKQADHGDFATNAAMVLTKALKRPPRDIAADLAQRLQDDLGDHVERVDIAGPGFLNVVLADAWFTAALAGVLAAGDGFGAGGADPVRDVNVEFVSANPTGPLHVGHTRNAAYGDALARILELRGHRVSREYYVNDYGTQVVKFGESVQARARGEEVPQDGYQGDYVAEIAAEIPGAADADPSELALAAVELMRSRAEASLRRFGVEMDTWFSERSLHEPAGDARVEAAFARLEEQGRTFRQDGALWLRTTEFGDDKDRVLERSTGEHTYFASDVAYYLDKLDRGFDLLIDVWGADHHGYMGRIHAVVDAFGGRREDFELLIMQFVQLRNGDDLTAMSKRRGTLVTLDDLVDAIGVDAARWYLLARSHDTQVELDLAAAREQSRENPVYYVQYAHARIASVLREQGEERVAAALAAVGTLDGVALHASERDLVKAVLDFPAVVAEAEERRAPHRIATYATELAQQFSAFYRDCSVKNAEPEELRSFRIALCVAAKATLARSLGLLGVSAPQEM
ncbi:arginine--tRNA ligase [Paraconexibacter algicola]|uniref:Arginine--tRNA ligase n=1 Tax=Paraconexibacter algicola TaxID=2133960 RepID=A0A2T4UDX4_9ACTN|nr:arginine--tRNA ligase [Paraconexibacter algicola]PTL55706.1 arginine--tRNA ligase [Paraconexibacter algicola]